MPFYLAPVMCIYIHTYIKCYWTSNKIKKIPDKKRQFEAFGNKLLGYLLFPLYLLTTTLSVQPTNTSCSLRRLLLISEILRLASNWYDKLLTYSNDWRLMQPDLVSKFNSGSSRKQNKGKSSNDSKIKETQCSTV